MVLILTLILPKPAQPLHPQGEPAQPRNQTSREIARQALLNQLGLELVRSREPVEMCW